MTLKQGGNMETFIYGGCTATLHEGDCVTGMMGLPDQSFDCCVTDPPYKLSQSYGEKPDPDNVMAVASAYRSLQQVHRLLRPGGVCFVCYDNRLLPVILHAAKAAGMQYMRAVTLYRRWGPASLVDGWMSTSDICCVFKRPGGKTEWHGKAAHDVFVKRAGELYNAGHPAQKPLDFMRQVIQRVCPPEGLILEPYAGSGTTLVAALAEGRSIVGWEEATYAVAHRRLSTVDAEIAQSNRVLNPRKRGKVL